MTTIAPAQFDLGSPVSRVAGFVRRKGKLFRVGEYPDKGFSLSAAEMAQAVAEFSPVPIDLEHRSTPLDGKLGHLESVEISGDELHGTAALDARLDDLLAEGKRRVSLMWDRAKKRIIGLALVNTPRITDAALFAAFSSSDGTTRETWDLLRLTDTGRAVLRSRGLNPDHYEDPLASFSGDKPLSREHWNLLRHTDAGCAVIRDRGMSPASY